MTKKRGPVVIELDDAETPAVMTAPPVDTENTPVVAGTEPVEMPMLRETRRPRLLRWFVGLGLSLAGLLVSAWLWELALAAYYDATLFGTIIAGLVALLAVVGVLIGLKELFALLRVRRVEALRNSFERILAGEDDLAAARHNLERLARLYASRPEAEWGISRAREVSRDMLDADAVVALAEDEIVQVFDKQVIAEIEVAARRVATITAIVPLALVDVATAFLVNLRMIRRIAEIYGGRAGFVSSWRLLRAVIGHIAATGVVAVGDDVISSIAGGGVVSKISRRFGEGVVNGALTTRVGIVAMEVCRPLPFVRAKKPTVSGAVTRALAGLFGGR